jgi:hypothetical protein
VARGELAHQLVQRGLARDEILQRLHDAHRAQRIGHHQADEGVCGHVGDGCSGAVGHPGVDEPQVERRLGQTLVQRRDLLRNRDVDRLHDKPVT